jgi:hypothetical protein
VVAQRWINHQIDGLSIFFITLSKIVEQKFRVFPIYQDGSTETFASARDIGNVAAGYMAGNNGLSWSSARTAFDARESYQQGKFAIEGSPTQRAERVGYNAGGAQYDERRIQAIWKDATRKYPIGPKE